MNKNNLFKLYKYCINFYCHKYHNDIYLTDNEWLRVFSSKKYYNQLRKKLKTKDIFLSSIDYVDDCFFLSINYSVNRFKRILKLLQDNNIFYEFNIATRIIQLPVSLLLNKTTAPVNFNVSINEKELLRLIKDNNTEYLYDIARIILKQHNYHITYHFYYGKFLKAYIQYMQNVPATYTAINMAYSNLFSLKLNYKRYKGDNDILSNVFNDLFIRILSDKFAMSKFTPSISNIITNFAKNLNADFVKDINQQCINNIYDYIHKNYIMQPLTPYNIYFTMTGLLKLYELLNFNDEQKKILNDFFIKVKAQHLLLQL